MTLRFCSVDWLCWKQCLGEIHRDSRGIVLHCTPLLSCLFSFLCVAQDTARAQLAIESWDFSFSFQRHFLPVSPCSTNCVKNHNFYILMCFILLMCNTISCILVYLCFFSPLTFVSCFFASCSNSHILDREHFYLKCFSSLVCPCLDGVSVYLLAFQNLLWYEINSTHIFSWIFICLAISWSV